MAPYFPHTVQKKPAQKYKKKHSFSPIYHSNSSKYAYIMSGIVPFIFHDAVICKIPNQIIWPGIYKQKKGLPPYRYEGCKFPILNSSPELSDREAEIVIVRCLNVPLPQVNTY